VEGASDPGFERGTKITLKLKPNFRQFAKEKDVEEIIKKYSLFISHPIKLNGELLNNLQALWYRNKKEVSNDEYQRFYEYITGTKLLYKYILHYSSDVPLTIKALLFIPTTHTEKMGIGQEPSQISLYSRKILIKQKMTELLPRYLRFVKGVVDCEDIPLNLSRETYQGSAHIEKLKGTLTKRIIKLLEDEMKKDLNSYQAWYKDFSIFLKEGLTVDRDNAPDILKLILFKCSFKQGQVTLDDYIQNLVKDQKAIYFLYSPTYEKALSSPYLEPFKAVDIPVIFTEHNLDEVCLKGIGKYKDLEFVNIETSFESIVSELEKKYPQKLQKKATELVPEEDIAPLCLWAKNEFDGKVTKVTSSKRPSSSPGMILGQISSSMRQIMSLMGQMNESIGNPDMQVELNVSHKLIRQINTLRKSNPPLASLLIKSLLDYMMISTAIPIDPVPPSNRSLLLIEQLAEASLKGPKKDLKGDFDKKEGKKSVLNEAKDIGKKKDAKKNLEFIINEKGEAVLKE